MTAWDSDRLETDRLAAIATLRRERITEPLEQYLAAFDTDRDSVRLVLEQTQDLSRLAAVAVGVLADRLLLDAVRYLAGPPLSMDDLRVLADVPSLAPSRLRADPGAAGRLVATVLAALDCRRYPWVGEDRAPTQPERAIAIDATAALMASQQIQTARRSGGKAVQKAAV